MNALLQALLQASWQGAIFSVLVCAVCALRLPASVRASLWLLVGVKFVGVFLWLLCFGERGTVGVGVLPPVTMRVPAAYATPLATAWLLGVGVCAAMVLLRVRATYCRVQSARRPASPDVQNILAALTAPPAPSVRIIPANECPQVTILAAKPVILLPANLLPPSPDALGSSDLWLLLAHEVAHIRRGDLWAGWVFALAQTLFFFHPCAAWAKHEWELAREEACDLFALRAGAMDGASGENAARYGALLVRIGNTSRTAFGGRSTTGAAFLAMSPFSALRRRLQHLGRAQTAQTPLTRCYAALLVLLFGGLLLPLRPAPPVLSAPAGLVFVPATPAPVARQTVVVPRMHPAPRPDASVPLRTQTASVVVVTRPVTRREKSPLNRRRLPLLREPDTVSAPVLAMNAPTALRLSTIVPPEPIAAPVPAELDAPETLADSPQEMVVSAGAGEISVAPRTEIPATTETLMVRTGEPAVSVAPVRAQGRTSQPASPVLPNVPEAQVVPLVEKKEDPSPRPH